MTITIRLLGAALCATLICSCASTPGRLLQAMGRTVGLVAQADVPSSTDAVFARGQQIEQRGTHQLPATAQAGTSVAQR